VEVDFKGTATFTGALPVAPGIFTLPDGSAAVQHADYSLVTETHPVAPGETIIIYAAGFGPYLPSVQSGMPAIGPAQLYFSVPPIVSIGGTICGLFYVGPTPLYVGLYQINCQTSPQIPSGAQPLQIVFPVELFLYGPTPSYATNSNIVSLAVQ
jgi:uncharacterized protein (TIGR03437 family)